MSQPLAVGPHAQRGMRLLLAAAALTLAVYTLQIATGFGGAGIDELFGIWVYDALVAAGAALCIGRAIVVPRERLVWALLGGGLAAWTAGEIYFSVFLADVYPTPIPSPSDFLFLAFYPAAYASLLLMMRSRLGHLEAGRWLDGLIGGLGIGALAAAILMGPVLDGIGNDPAAVVTILAYPVGDLVLLGLVASAFTLAGWRPGLRWALLGAGLTAMAVGDGLFIWMDARGVYSSLVEPLWPLGALLIGSASWARESGDPRAREGGRAIIAPVLFAGLAAALLAGDHFLALNPWAYGLATATLAVVVLRLYLGYLDRQHLLDQVTRRSLTDELTQLGNRRRLLEDLEALRDRVTASSSAVLLLLDLDGFKGYNDLFGHPAGDTMLTRLAEQLRVAMPQASCYRLGGDEFCVLAGGDRSAAPLLQRTAQAALSARGEDFLVTASCGFALMPSEVEAGPEALRIADRRLYADKSDRGGPQVEVRRPAPAPHTTNTHLPDAETSVAAPRPKVNPGAAGSG